MVKYVFIFLGLFAACGIGVILYYYFFQGQDIITPIEEQAEKIIEKPLEKYQISRLQEVEFVGSEITLGEVVNEDDDIVSRMFYFEDRGATGDIEGVKVSGLINLPKEEGRYPVIVMFRGFVDPSFYTTGEGTRRTGEEIARNGFITLAPDFLGYGESDMPSVEPIEERFQTYTTALSLFASLPDLNNALASDPDISVRADEENVGVWAHSNGGQIALTALGVSGHTYPTVLWAPVTKPFPYNILYFTDEFEDEGKALRKVVADFEEHYDVFEYSITRDLESINAPLQIHQGTDDEAVPLRWSDQFVDILEEKEMDVTYFVYPGENHNFNNGSWPTAVARSIEFFTNPTTVETE